MYFNLGRRINIVIGVFCVAFILLPGIVSATPIEATLTGVVTRDDRPNPITGQTIDFLLEIDDATTAADLTLPNIDVFSSPTMTLSSVVLTAPVGAIAIRSRPSNGVDILLGNLIGGSGFGGNTYFTGDNCSDITTLLGAFTSCSSYTGQLSGINNNGGPIVVVQFDSLSTQVIPEPSTAILFGIGLLGLSRHRRA